MDRVDLIKQLLKEKPPNIRLEEGETKQKIEQTYVKRLESGQQSVNNLLVQAEDAINKLQQKLKDVNPDLETEAEDVQARSETDHEVELELKRQAIAMYNTYGKIPFSPDKNDVITIASASTIIHSLIDENARATRSLGSNSALDERIQWLNSTLREYKQLSGEMDGLTHDRQQHLEALQRRDEDQITSDSVERKLDEKLEETEHHERILLQHLSEVSARYIESENAQDTGVLQPLILGLISSRSEWVEIPKDSPEQQLIRTLLLNDIIHTKPHPDSSMQYIGLSTVAE